MFPFYVPLPFYDMHRRGLLVFQEEPSYHHMQNDIRTERTKIIHQNDLLQQVLWRSMYNTCDGTQQRGNSLVVKRDHHTTC